MKVLVTSKKEDAQARSRAEWEKVLGRPKKPEDVTEFLWSVVDNEDGTYGVVVPEEDVVRLTKSESSKLRTTSLRLKEDGDL